MHGPLNVTFVGVTWVFHLIAKRGINSVKFKIEYFRFLNNTSGTLKNFFMSPYTVQRAVVGSDPRLRNFVVYQFFLFPFHVRCFPSRKPHTVGLSWLVQCWCPCSTATTINSQHYDPIGLKSCDCTSFVISSFTEKTKSSGFPPRLNS